MTSAFLGGGDQLLTEDAGAKQVDAHRAKGVGRIVGDRWGVRRLLDEVRNPEILIHVDHAESMGLFDWNIDRADHGIGAFGDQPMEHLHIVHLVDMIAGEDKHIVWLFGVEEKQVLIDRVGGALVPFFADPLLRWNRGDEFAEFGIQDVPAHADVPVKRVGFVLDEDSDFSKPRVEAVAERKIDNTIFPSEENRRLGPMFGEGLKTLALPARQHHGEHVQHCGQL